MARMLFFALLAALCVAAVWYIVSHFAGRPVVSDRVGKVLVLVTLAALAWWLFGPGGLVVGAP